MFTNTRIYNYFTNNQTQSYQVNEEDPSLLYEAEYLRRVEKLNTDFNAKMTSVEPKYKNIKITTNKGDESITEEYSSSSNYSLSDKLQAFGIDNSQILKIMTFANKELSEICNPLIDNGLSDLHYYILGDSFDANLEIIIKKRDSIPQKVEVKISNIRNSIYPNHPTKVNPDYIPFKELYMFSGQIAYNPTANKFTFTSKLISGKSPSIIFRLIVKIQSLLAAIFRA